jgi:hypothetical protein
MPLNLQTNNLFLLWSISKPADDNGNGSPCVNGLYVPSKFIFIIGPAFNEESKKELSFLSNSIPSGF